MNIKSTRKTGIYTIYQLTASTGESYIGRTEMTLEARLADHLAKLRQGMHNPLIQPAYDAGATFTIKSLFQTTSKQEAKDAEIELINTHLGAMNVRSSRANIAFDERFNGMAGRVTPAIRAAFYDDCKVMLQYEAAKKHGIPQGSITYNLRAEATKRGETVIPKVAHSHNPEVRAIMGKKISESNRRRMNDPIEGPKRRALFSENAKRLWANPEYRAKISAALSAAHRARAKAAKQGD